MKKARSRLYLALAHEIVDLGAPRPDDAEWVRRFRLAQSHANGMLPSARRPGVPPPSKAELTLPKPPGVRVVHSKRWLRCEVCFCEDQANLSRHHCVPQALGGGGECVTLCGNCHKLAHKIWGPGDRYQGPETAQETLRGLRDYQRNQGLIDSRRQREQNLQRARIRQGLADLCRAEGEA